MIVETVLIVGAAGIGALISRLVRRHLGGRRVGDAEIAGTLLDGALGVRDGELLDVWLPHQSTLPARVTRLLRGVPEDGRGLRLSLYLGDPGARGPERRVVRAWLGPYPTGSASAFVQVELRVDARGGIRIRATDQPTGRLLELTDVDKHDRDAATILPTTRAGDDEGDRA